MTSCKHNTLNKLSVFVCLFLFMLFTLLNVSIVAFLLVKPVVLLKVARLVKLDVLFILQLLWMATLQDSCNVYFCYLYFCCFIFFLITPCSGTSVMFVFAFCWYQLVVVVIAPHHPQALWRKPHLHLIPYPIGLKTKFHHTGSRRHMVRIFTTPWLNISGAYIMWICIN